MSRKRKVRLNSLSEVMDLQTNTTLGFDNLRNNSFIKKLGEDYSSFSLNSCYSNELFVNFYIKKKEWEALLEVGDELIETDIAGMDGLIWNDLASKNTTKKISFLNSFLMHFPLIISSIALMGSCVIKSLFSKRLTLCKDKNVAFVRSRATSSKINKVKDKFDFACISEGITFSDESMPSLFNYIPFHFFILKVPYLLLSSCKDLLLIRRELSFFFKANSVDKVAKFYIQRVLLKSIYELMICFVVKKQKKVNADLKIFTGNKEDRFAMVEQKLATETHCELICIPHGLEYSFKFPTGIAGDTFYCTSYASYTLLNQIYDDKKIVFDFNLNELIYSSGEKKTVNEEKKIYFFTESREINVNKNIISLLNKNGVEFKVKLHPADSITNYSDLNIEIESDYNKSLTNSICIARKSTVLLEALYNNSIAIAFLIDSKDDYYATYVFPSLSDVQIKRAFTIEELILHLKKGRNNYV